MFGATGCLASMQKDAVILCCAGGSWMLQNHVPHILAGDDTPFSAVILFVKDLGIILGEPRALTFRLPMAAAAHQLFLAAADAGNYPYGRCEATNRRPGGLPPRR